MTCRDNVGTTDPDKSESKRYLVVPNCFLGYQNEYLQFVKDIQNSGSCPIDTIPTLKPVVYEKYTVKYCKILHNL